MKFIVYAPGDYSPNGGGSVALHKLAHNIASLGEQCYIVTSKKNPNYLATQITEQDGINMCNRCSDIMVIYPEVTQGNPLKSKNVTRWILYHVRNYGDYGIYADTDLIYKYAADFRLRFQRPHICELRAHEMNLDIFFDRNKPRSGDCFLIKKGNDKEHNYHSHSAICLDNYPAHGDNANQYLADVFNRCEVFISYDTATWLNVMAALCGCVSVVIPDKDVIADTWYNGYPYFKYGIAYGMNELNHAKETLHLVRPTLKSIEDETIRLTQQFIYNAKKQIKHENNF